MKNRYKINGDTTIIYMQYKNEPFETVIETEDLETLLNIDNTWCVYKPTRLKGKSYVKGKIGGKSVYLHRVLCKTDMMVDHINRNPMDNRKSNLRPATPLMNTLNRDPMEKESCRGVSWDKRTNKWKAYLNIKGKHKDFGRYKNLEDAERIVNVKRKEYQIV